MGTLEHFLCLWGSRSLVWVETVCSLPVSNTSPVELGPATLPASAWLQDVVWVSKMTLLSFSKIPSEHFFFLMYKKG